jgi:hypothetical protein
MAEQQVVARQAIGYHPVCCSVALSFYVASRVSLDSIASPSCAGQSRYRQATSAQPTIHRYEW